MSGSRPPAGRKFFTPQQANATLPLVRSIIRDVTDLAAKLRIHHERLAELSATERLLDPEEQHDVDKMQEQLERGVEQMREYQQELAGIGIILKDYFKGLIDFPCWMDGREVYLCWCQGEPNVSWWHEIEAGFAGRQKISLTPGAFQ